MRYDVMIIGGGPGGYTAANKAAANGLKTILFEKREIGGTCLNRGCIPMKALIEASRLYRNSLNGELFGVYNEKTSFDYVKVNERKRAVIDQLRSGVEKSLRANKVEVVNGEARLIDKDRISCNGEIYEGENIILAAGSIPAKPPIEGIEYAISSDEVLSDDFVLPESLIIIGGGVIGCEIADALNGFGVKVIILEMADRLLPTLDKDLGQRLGMFFKKRGIEVNCSAAVKSISENREVSYVDKKGNELSVSADAVLVATGRKANLEGLIGEDVELSIQRGVVADEEGRTNIEGVYCIGDAKANNIQLAHVAEAQGENIVDLILNKKPSIDMSVIPSAVYTEPEIASVGYSEEELKKQDIEYVSKKVLTGANGRCLIENSESGFVKVLIADDKIVGGSIVAPHASELISELAIAVEKKMSPEDLEEVIHPHPSISEMIWDVVK
ncbi:MAG: dihydrolipoyl dehydrogenase [Erysipelotrichaceae bacterium]|nr:dihydrolipoyl dehydrogenase [Erysipelotrichaceae bacterium]